MANILIVDDERPIRELLRQILEPERHECALAQNAAEARQLIKKNLYELILCDVTMPGESGFDFARYVVANHPDTVVVMVTATDDVMAASSAFEIGVYDYVTKPFDRNRVLITVVNALIRRDLELTNKNCISNLERLVARQTADLRESITGLQMALEGTVRAIAGIVDRNDPFTAGHQKRVAELACAIGHKMGLPKEQVDILGLAGMLHDLGKIFIPAQILSKPGKLSSAEFELVKEHPRDGYFILRDIAFPWQVAKAVLQHHERLDGSGYPQGLKGDEIIMEARILAVADVVEAMSSDRSYRPGPGFAMGLAEIEKYSGVLYDSKVVDVCLALFTQTDFAFANGDVDFSINKSAHQAVFWETA